MKTAIVYYSKHHGNTKKLLDAIQNGTQDEITLIDVTQTPSADLSGYDQIGFASGIYAFHFQKSVIRFAEEHLPSGKNVFLLYTYGVRRGDYTRSIREAIDKKGATILGEYGCLGFDTFGPFKLVGGIAKGHPDRDELEGAVKFYQNLNP